MECECSEEEEQALQMLAMGALPNPPPAGPALPNPPPAGPALPNPPPAGPALPNLPPAGPPPPAPAGPPPPAGPPSLLLLPHGDAHHPRTVPVPGRGGAAGEGEGLVLGAEAVELAGVEAVEVARRDRQ